MTQAVERRTRRATRKAVRDTFARIGMQARPREVVRELASRGVHVSEEFVRLVQVEMLKQTDTLKRRRAGFPQLAHLRMRQAPRAFPRRGGRSN
jgi:hypothetical protein